MADVARPRPSGRIPLGALFVAHAVSTTGDVLSLVAIPWFVLQTTGSPFKTGLTATFAFIPTALSAFFGGAVVERLGYKRTSVIADILSATATALIPFLYMAARLSFWLLLALVFVKNLLDAPGSTARSALLPDMAQEAGMRMERATSVIQANERGAQLIGAPLAGLLIALLTASRVLWVDAATFAVSALLIAAVIPRTSLQSESAVSSGYWENLRHGLRFLQRERVVRTIILTVMLTNFLGAPLFSIVLPVYAHRVLHSPVDLGVMIAVYGGGSLLGAIIFGAIGHQLPRRPTFLTAFVAVAVFSALLVPLPGLVIATASLGLRGLAAGPINPILGTVRYERVPADMRGRVFGVATAGSLAAVPLGMALTGYLIQGVGLQLTLAVQCACYIAITLGLLLVPAFRDMDTPGVPPVDSAGA